VFHIAKAFWPPEGFLLVSEEETKLYQRAGHVGWFYILIPSGAHCRWTWLAGDRKSGLYLFRARMRREWPFELVEVGV
jgi:hypothetical protein